MRTKAPINAPYPQPDGVRPRLFICAPRSLRRPLVSVASLLCVSSSLPHRLAFVPIENEADDLVELLAKLSAPDLRSSVVAMFGRHLWALESEETAAKEERSSASVRSPMGQAARIALLFPEVLVLASNPAEGNGDGNGLCPEFHDFSRLAGANVDSLESRLRTHAEGYRVLYDASQMRAKLKLEHLPVLKVPGGYHERVERLLQSRKTSATICFDDEVDYADFVAYASFGAISSRTHESVGTPKRGLPVHSLRLANRVDAWSPRQLVGTSITNQRVADRSIGWDDVPHSATSEGLFDQIADASTLVISGAVEPASSAGTSVSKSAMSLHLFRDLLGCGSSGGQAASVIASSAGATSSVANAWGNHPPVPAALGRIGKALGSRALHLAATEPPDVRTALHIATLCIEAQELIAGGAVALATELVCIRNLMEVVAEVSAFSASPALDARRRICEVEAELNALHATEPTLVRGKSVAAVMTHFIHELRAKYAEYEQPEAAEACTRELWRFRTREIQEHIACAIGQQIARAISTTANWANAITGTETNRTLPATDVDRFPVLALGRWYVWRVLGGGTSFGRLALSAVAWWAAFTVLFFFSVYLSDTRFAPKSDTQLSGLFQAHAARDSARAAVADGNAIEQREALNIPTSCAEPSGRWGPFLDFKAEYLRLECYDFQDGEHRNTAGQVLAISAVFSALTFVQLGSAVSGTYDIAMRRFVELGSLGAGGVILVSLLEYLVSFIHFGVLIAILLRRLSRNST